MVALVDDSDYKALSQHKWQAHKRPSGAWYAVRGIRDKHRERGKNITIYMHREILGISDNTKLRGDHRDRNGLNNQRFNLRICTQSQNLSNKVPRKSKTSRFKGVSFHKIGKEWKAQIQVNNRSIHLGLFKNEEDAALAYHKASEKYYGEFAYHLSSTHIMSPLLPHKFRDLALSQAKQK